MNKFALVLLSVIFVSCGPTQHEQALEAAGSNRRELERVVNHHDSLGDKDKRQAAMFLIENMDGKQSVVSYKGCRGEDFIMDNGVQRWY